MHLLAALGRAGRPRRDGQRRLPSLSATVAAGAAALLLVWAASLTSPWDRLEMKVFDTFTALAAPGRSAVPVAVLSIDPATAAQEAGGAPSTRSLHARLLDRLQADGAAAVGFDLAFDQPAGAAEDAAFERSVAAASSVVLAFAPAAAPQDALAQAAALPLQRFLAAGAVPGDAQVRPDGDGVVRRANAHINSFAGKLAALADARAARTHRAAAPSEFVVYRGPPGTFDTRPWREALEPGVLPPGFFRGKIVLVGHTLPADRSSAVLGGLFASPFALGAGERHFPAVELQATLIDNQLTGARLRSVDSGWSPVVLMLGLPLLLAGGWRWPGAAGAFALAGAGAMVVASWLLFQRGLWWPPLFPALAVLASYAAAVGLAPRATLRRKATVGKQTQRSPGGN